MFSSIFFMIKENYVFIRNNTPDSYFLVNEFRFHLLFSVSQFLKWKTKLFSMNNACRFYKRGFNSHMLVI